MHAVESFQVDSSDPGRQTPPSPQPAAPGAGMRALVVRGLSWLRSCLRQSFCLASLIVLLAVLTAIPLLQLIAFGYLLDVAGRLTRGSSLREALPNLDQAGTVGLAGLAVLVASLPPQLLSHWASVASLIDPGSQQAWCMRMLALAAALLALAYLMWAWVRGGRWYHYAWPQPKRFLREGLHWGTWSDAADRLWRFTASLQPLRLLWLGMRGAAGTLLWLVPAMLIILINRNGRTGLAGVLGAVSLILLGAVLLYLPMLQAHFASENRIGALFELRQIRRDFRRAPWAWFFAMVGGLVLMPIPLYLLKIEATPREVLWLPCLVFVAFILPARIAEGLALRRARRRPEPLGVWAACSRGMVRLMMPAVVGVYLLFVYVSQYTSWNGLQTWIQQHAILVPVPSVGV